MENLGRHLILAGILLILIGGAVYLAGRAGLPFGRLPGDIRVEWRGGSLYVPIVTSIILSVVLTLILNLVIRLLHK
jgi:uncharacterized membrane protein YidH (DUF202 family)